ncbi:hypothetical protein QBC43DRAFT_312669, partial [Cladorrhinum sp. PSN259]
MAAWVTRPWIMVMLLEYKTRLSRPLPLSRVSSSCFTEQVNRSRLFPWVFFPFVSFPFFSFLCFSLISLGSLFFSFPFVGFGYNLVWASTFLNHR